MTSLIGLAYTNPAITVVAIDNELFRVHLYEKGKLTDLNLFLQSTDARKPVILITSVEDLKQIQEVKNIHSFILFDELEILQKIVNIKILDVNDKQKQINITPKFLNEILQTTDNFSFSISEEALNYRQKMTTRITFKDMMIEIIEMLIKIKKQKEFIEEFLVKTCKYVVNLISKKIWITDVRNKLVTLELPIESIVELEKWLTSNIDAQNLSRAYRMIAEDQKVLEDVIKEIPDLIKEDIEYIVNTIGAEKGQKYVKTRKKRKKQ